MSFSSFQEYIDHKKKLKKDPKIEKIADYHGPKSNKPEKEKKHKDAGGCGQVGSTKEYKPSNEPIDPNKNKKDGKGFADQGDKALKYEPGDVWVGGKNGVSKSTNGMPGGKNVSTWPKTKTQEWVNNNKGISMSEFTKRIQREIKDECNENAYNTIRNVIELCQCNQKYIENLVREMKRNNLLPLLSEAVATKEINDIDGEMDGPENMDGSEFYNTNDEDMDDEDEDEDMDGEDRDGEDNDMDMDGEDNDMDMDGEDDDMDMDGENDEDIDIDNDDYSALGEPEGNSMNDMSMSKNKMKRKKHPHAAHALSSMQGPKTMDSPMMMKKK